MVFPFDEDFPQYELAKKQMQGACGLFSFYIKTNSIKEIETFCENLQHILMAVSWGGYESLIIPGCASLKEEDFDANNREHRQLRMYVGLEDAQYIIDDLGKRIRKDEKLIVTFAIIYQKVRLLLFIYFNLPLIQLLFPDTFK